MQRYVVRSRRPRVPRDSDSVVADRFALFDEVPVPDTWELVQSRMLDESAGAVDKTESPMEFEPVARAGSRRRGSALARAGGLVAAAAAVVVALSVVDQASRDESPSTPQSSLTMPDEVLNPLVSLRSQLTNDADVEMFRVRSDTQSYWRLTTLPEFDGEVWGMPESELGYTGDLAEGTREGREIRQEIEIQALTGSLVPVAPEPIQASAQADELQWSDALGALVATTELASGDRFEIVSRSPSVSAEQLRTATTDDPPGPGYTVLPSSVPAPLADTAQVVTAGARSSYEAAMLLQAWFQREFDYSLEVQPGHGYSAIEDLLRTRTGGSEQFASAFAVLARTLGIPSRVAVGFTPGALREDGWYSVSGRNAHAWPDIWFDDLGWVPFEPTPARSEPPTTESVPVTPIVPATALPTSDDLGDGTGSNYVPLADIDDEGLRPLDSLTPEDGDIVIPTAPATWSLAPVVNIHPDDEHPGQDFVVVTSPASADGVTKTLKVAVRPVCNGTEPDCGANSVEYPVAPIVDGLLDVGGNEWGEQTGCCPAATAVFGDFFIEILDWPPTPGRSLLNDAAIVEFIAGLRVGSVADLPAQITAFDTVERTPIDRTAGEGP
jgi:transglutaminase-like putative cysteine protease